MVDVKQAHKLTIDAWRRLESGGMEGPWVLQLELDLPDEEIRCMLTVSEFRQFVDQCLGLLGALDGKALREEVERGG